mmetsp:Transcript_27356/g.64286  ORF Transcript_27356/g.64286 Transcript_27356/m.64286 type:complete len:551 (+) Transcript_27356:36-1688(+)
MENKTMCLMALAAAICFLTIIGSVCTGVGSLLLNSADAAEYREAQCLVVSSRTPDGSRRRRTSSTVSYCDFTLNTSITGEQTFTRLASCSVDGVPCTRCNSYGPASGQCWVVYRGGDATGVAFLPAEIVGTFFGLAMTAMGATSFALCCLGCSCMRVTCIASGQQQPLNRINPQLVGRPDSGNAAPADVASAKKSAKVARLRESLSKFTVSVGVLVSGLDSMAIIWGLYLGIVLLYLHNRELEIAGKVLPASASWAGFGASGLFLFLLPLIWCLLFLAKRYVNGILDDLAGSCSSQQEVQERMSRALIEKLRSKEGERYRTRLLSVGVGEAAIERILTAPPEAMMDTVLEQLGAVCFAKIATMIFEEMVTPPFEDAMFMFAVTFLGVPGVLVCLSLWTACYCVTFEVGIASSVISFLQLLSAILLRLRYTAPYVVAFVALNIALTAALMIAWAQDGATGLSVLCFLSAFPGFAIWLACCLVFVFSLKPLAEAIFELLVEVDVVLIWQSFGCERDPEELRKKREAVRQSSGGCVARILGVDGLLDIAIAEL